MNSNILISNKLISKFILDRSKKFDVENLAIFFNFQKTFLCYTLESFSISFLNQYRNPNFEPFSKLVCILNIRYWFRHMVWSVLDHKFSGHFIPLFCHTFEEFSILKSLQLDHGQVWKCFLQLVIDLYGV